MSRGRNLHRSTARHRRRTHLPLSVSDPQPLIPGSLRSGYPWRIVDSEIVVLRRDSARVRLAAWCEGRDGMWSEEREL